MAATRTTGVKSPGWIRALQIGIGALAIGLSISAMIYPVIATVATFTAAAIILLLFGIEQVVTGVFLYKESRFTHIGLGALIIILSSLVMVYPLATATLVIWLAAFALLLGGVASIISGLWVRNRRNYRTAGRGSRALSIGAGALAVALSIAIMVFPVFGVELAGVLIGIALLFYGIRLVVTGISGRGRAVTSASTDTMAA
jgi:uncharacterized membrane protein HdeD (DUF308 family)